MLKGWSSGSVAGPRGFTLVEVLVAIVVLSIGVLGVAALQMRGLVQAQGTLQGSQAVMLANAYADMMRANPAAAEAGLYQISADVSATAPSPACNTATACTAAQLAAWDQYVWFRLQLLATLPTGTTARVSCVDGANCASSAVQIITVYWNQARAKDASGNIPTGLGCGADPTVDLACASVSLQP